MFCVAIAVAESYSCAHAQTVRGTDDQTAFAVPRIALSNGSSVALPQPLTPGEIYAFDIEVLPISYVFKQGHRIRLELANGDSPATDGVFSHPYHPSLMGTDTFHHGGVYASCLILPIIE